MPDTKPGTNSVVLDLLAQYATNLSAPDQNRATLINMYLEEDGVSSLTKDPQKGEYKYIAKPSLGLSLFGDTGEANVRAMYEQNEVLYVVAGNKFGSVN